VHDHDLNRLFDEVTFLLRHPRALTRPSVRLRAILLNRRAGTRAGRWFGRS
jgi:hypothetical protein